MIDRETAEEILSAIAQMEEGHDRCGAQNEEIKTEIQGMRGDVNRVSQELEELSERQAHDDRAHESVATSIKVIRVIAAIATVVVLPIVGWLGSQAWGHYFAQVDRIDSAVAEVNDTRRAAMIHAASRGHEPTREDVQENREAIAAINAQLETIVTEQAHIRETQERILRAVNRPQRYGQ